MCLEAKNIRILRAKHYEDQFKLLYDIEENPADIFETHGITTTMWTIDINNNKQYLSINILHQNAATRSNNTE